MKDLVKEYIDTKEAEKRQAFEERKKDLLMDLGLFNKIESEKNEWSSEFPYSDGGKYYRKEVCEVSDEEYAKILELMKEENTEENKIANVLTVIAWFIYIGGAMAGFSGGYINRYEEFSLFNAVIIWVSTFISGTIFLAFAEVIKILHKIRLDIMKSSK